MIFFLQAKLLPTCWKEKRGRPQMLFLLPKIACTLRFQIIIEICSTAPYMFDSVNIYIAPRAFYSSDNLMCMVATGILYYIKFLRHPFQVSFSRNSPTGVLSFKCISISSSFEFGTPKRNSNIYYGEA